MLQLSFCLQLILVLFFFSLFAMAAAVLPILFSFSRRQCDCGGILLMKTADSVASWMSFLAREEEIGISKKRKDDVEKKPFRFKERIVSGMRIDDTFLVCCTRRTLLRLRETRNETIYLVFLMNLI